MSVHIINDLMSSVDVYLPLKRWLQWLWLMFPFMSWLDYSQLLFFFQSCFHLGVHSLNTVGVQTFFAVERACEVGFSILFQNIPNEHPQFGGIRAEYDTIAGCNLAWETDSCISVLFLLHLCHVFNQGNAVFESVPAWPRLCTLSLLFLCLRLRSLWDVLDILILKLNEHQSVLWMKMFAGASVVIHPLSFS